MLTGVLFRPLLWFLVADKIIKQYNRNQRFIISYIDDLVVFEGADTRQALETKINRIVPLFDNIATQLHQRFLCLFILLNRRLIFMLSSISISVKDTEVGLYYRYYVHLDRTSENGQGQNSRPRVILKSSDVDIKDNTLNF